MYITWKQIKCVLNGKFILNIKDLYTFIQKMAMKYSFFVSSRTMENTAYQICLFWRQRLRKNYYTMTFINGGAFNNTKLLLLPNSCQLARVFHISNLWKSWIIYANVFARIHSPAVANTRVRSELNLQNLSSAFDEGKWITRTSKMLAVSFIGKKFSCDAQFEVCNKLYMRISYPILPDTTF